MTVIEILLAILIIAASALCVYLIKSLIKLNETLDLIRQDIHTLSEKTLPVLENLNETTRNLNRVTSDVESKVGDIISVVDRYKEKFLKIKYSATESSGNPIINLVRNLRAISKGTLAFVRKFKE
ncbi:MAG: DUF948 domain-containing protein [bacterium]